MITLPTKYQYLLKETGPKMLTEALKLVGTKEFKGAKHNPVILGWAEALNIKKIYTTDELAWCGLSHAIVIVRAGKPLRFKDYDILRALKYAEFGEAVPEGEAMLADTLVFKRPGGGHVGLYVGESKTTYHVLGGNQNNEYGFTEISKARCVAVRRPEWLIAQPSNVRKIFLNASGIVSGNEA